MPPKRMSTQFSPRRFRRLIAGVAVLLLLALFVHLGQWQSGKADAGLEQRARYAARANDPPVTIGSSLADAARLEFARVVARGEYESAGQFYVDNQIHDGRPGVHVITPLRIAGGETRLLVNRGWVAWPDRRVPPPAMPPPAGPQTLTGLAAAPAVPAFMWMPDRAEAFPTLWRALDVARFARESGRTVQPVVLYLEGEAGLVPVRPAPTDKVEMHRGYALQWYGMAVALLLFYAIAALRKARSNQAGTEADGGEAK